MASVKAGELKSGQMVRSTLDTGPVIWPMAEAVLYTQMAMFMRDSGRTISLTDKVHIIIATVQSILVDGSRISKKVTVLKSGVTELLMKDITKMVKSKAKEHSSGQISRCLRASS